MKTGKAGLAERLWAKVDRRGPDECWPWIAKAVTSFGYGRMTAGRKVNLKAHRAAWMVTHGPIPDGLCVLHRCDNPACCNPGHLFLGTKRDNTHDMMSKGRHSPPPVRQGENHHKATIPDASLGSIRNSDMPTDRLAALYGVSSKTIYRIRNGLTRAA